MSKKEQDAYWVCFSGHEGDFEAGRAGLHYVERSSGEKWLVIFTTRAKAEEFVQANFSTPEAHMSMMESLPESHLAPLTGSRFTVAKLPREDIIELALEAGVDYLQRDIKPGSQQDIMRLKR